MMSHEKLKTDSSSNAGCHYYGTSGTDSVGNFLRREVAKTNQNNQYLLVLIPQKLKN